MAKAKRIIRSGDPTEPAENSEAKTDRLLTEMGRLYRERFRALYNKDLTTFQAVSEQIEQIKTQLTPP